MVGFIILLFIKAHRNNSAKIPKPRDMAYFPFNCGSNKILAKKVKMRYTITKILDRVLRIDLNCRNKYNLKSVNNE